MKTLKFGGTSVGSAERFKEVANLICDGEQKIVVLSAMSGTTNSLVEINNYLEKQNPNGAIEKIMKLEDKYMKVIEELYSLKEIKNKAKERVQAIFKYMTNLTTEPFTQVIDKIFLAQGEMISTNMFHLYLMENKISSCLLNSFDFMKKREDDEPDYAYIRENLTAILYKNKGYDYYIVQGYICLNHRNEIDNLSRGGSDYTASLIGAAIKSSEIEIWTDIDGMHNNDPRYVQNTKCVPELSFDEAAELAYFGAKILHPTCVLPAKMENIPVILKNTMEPKAHGTRITRHLVEPNKIKAIAAKDDITVINIKSSRMFLAYGFLKKVFDIFDYYKTPIDMVTTSEVGVSLSVDDTKYLYQIETALKELGTIEIAENQVIICIVGDLAFDNKALAAQALNTLTHIPVRMISYGGSQYNISIIVDKNHKEDALKSLNKGLFE